ncbi:MAG: hypothetical protein HC912_04710 [Saprospiraceae bacterium]|nr:hypothetical protein [Saprospiraceae bacterium]
MSLTGSNSDDRVVIRPSEQGAAIAVLYNEVAALAGGQRITAPVLEQKAAAELKKYAKELYDFRGKSLVVSGSNNVGEQVLVNAMNDLLGNYGTTLDFNHISLQRQGSDRDISTLVSRINSGKVPSAIIILDDANPAFDLPSNVKFAEAMSKVKLRISFATTFNETSALCDYVLPTHHYLESWGRCRA